MATQHDDNEMDTVNPWAATPPLEAAPATANNDHDDHEERDAWRRRSSNATTTGSSDEGGGDNNTLIEPSLAPAQQDNSHVPPQVTMDFDEFDPFRPDKTTTTTTTTTTIATPTTADSAEAIEREKGDSQKQSSAALVYSDTTPPPTPSKKERIATPASSSPSATKTNDERRVDFSGVGQSAPHYTSTTSNTTHNEASIPTTSSTPPVPASASEPSSSSSLSTTVQPQIASSSTNTAISPPSTTTPSTSTSSSNMNKAPSSSSSTGNVLSNPLATIASAFRKRDFSNSSSNSNTPSRSNTPMPPQGGSSSSSTLKAQGTAAGSNQGTPQSQSPPGSKSTNPPTGKPAPVILIRDNDDHILGEEFPSASMNNDCSTTSNSVGGKAKGNTSAAAKAAAQIVQQAAGTESAGIIGDEHPVTHHTNNNDDDDNEGGGGGGGGGNAVIQPAFDFNFFLDQMRNKSAEPIAKYLRSFLREFSKKMWNVNDQIRVINDFLDFIAIKMRENEIWRNDSEQEFDNAVEGMEKLVMNRVFHLTFVPALDPAQQATTQTDDLERDHVLSQRIKLFQWVSEEHLDLPEHKDTASFVEFAKQELRKINMYKAPRDKLICILNSCKVIFGLMRHLSLEDGADTFIPFLILVVLRANPDHLISNVQYIQRFRNPDRLAGENGYYLSSLNAAISFIETMDGSSLSNITQEQFEQNVEEAIRALPSDDDQQELPPAQKEKDPSQSQPLQGSSRAAASASSQSVPNSPTKPMNEKRSSYQAEASLHAAQQGPPRSQSPAEATRDFFLRSSDNLQKTVSKPLQALGKIFTEMGSESEMIAGYPGPGHQQQSSSAQGTAGHMHRQHQQPLSPHMGHQQQHHPPPTPRGQRPPSLRTRSTASLASPRSPQGRLPPLPPGAQGHYEPGYLPNPQQQHPSRPGNVQNRGSSYQAADFLDDSVPAEEVQATADKNYQATFNAKIDTLLNIFPGIERETLEIVLLSNGEDVERTIEGLLDMQ